MRTMKTWRVTLKTAPHTWSTIEVDGRNHTEAIAHARRLLGNHPFAEIA
ncbi:hypothetical protein [Mycobacterium avium]|nr:hypothetical protein [Mycobacterium avium]MDO2354663.1 hypothetical protein [Mycobacterium avium subsp. hominissuis]